MSDRTVREWLDTLAAELHDVVERPRREGELLLMAHLERDQLWLITHQETPVEDPKRLIDWLRRRQAHEPMEYITNRVSFYSQTFHIAPGALIPRPETELLIDRVLEAVDVGRKLTLVEVGVGSGAVSIVLAQHLPHARIIAVDISEEALAVARHNVEVFGLEERIELRQGNLLDPVPEPIDVLVSNPPYVAAEAPLEKNLDYEPATALFGGPVGDEIIRELLDAVDARKIPLSAFEFGYDQRERVAAYLHGRDYASLTFYRDLAGFDRGFVLNYFKESL
jgi:release factor glutamine methyltransferase